MNEHETPRASSRETAPTRAEFENVLRVFANNQFASGLAQGDDRVCNNDAVAAKDVLVALWDRLAASRAPAETSAPPKRCYYCEDAATQRVDDDWIWVCDQHATETTAPHVYDDGEEAGESEELVERARAASDAGQRGGDPPRKHKYTVAVDFDGVIHSYTTPWVDAVTIPDPPVAGAIDWLNRISEDFTVVIHTTRGQSAEGRDAVLRYLAMQGVGFVQRFTVTSEKVAALIYIDDRAYRFDGQNFPTAQQIHAARPWNKQPAAVVAPVEPAPGGATNG